MFLQEDKGLQTGADGQPDVAASIASANYFLGVLLFTVFQFGVSAFPDSAMLVMSLPTWYKHRDRQGAAAVWSGSFCPASLAEPAAWQLVLPFLRCPRDFCGSHCLVFPHAQHLSPPLLSHPPPCAAATSTRRSASRCRR